jgi:predicted DNA-binding protein with PD1-like motif
VRDFVFVVSVGKGQEVIETITREADKRGVRHAAVVSLIGAVEGCCVSVMPKDDPLDDVLTTYDQPFEMTGTGEIVDGKVHIHAVMGGEGGPVAGHLHWAKVQHWFAHVYVMPVTE